MQADCGTPHAPIYLIGDSEPASWRDRLATPLDPRHPTRHSIWTAVSDYMQEQIFVKCAKRLSASALYVRNAVRNATDKPTGLQVDWGLDTNVTCAIADLAVGLARDRPLLVISFGQFAFEFCRRALDEQPQRSFGYWTKRELGAEFRRRLSAPSSGGPLLAPLLHASVARGQYLEAHTEFCNVPPTTEPNYFKYTGVALADWIIEKHEEFEARGAFLKSDHRSR
jgi:hypothetical protein